MRATFNIFPILLALTAASSSVIARADKTMANPDRQLNAPLVAVIYSRDCPVCAKVRPILSQLKSAYAPSVQFIDLDVTDDDAIAKSKKVAASLHLSVFFNLYSGSFPCVGIFNKRSESIRELCGLNSKEKYELYIAQALKS